MPEKLVSYLSVLLMTLVMTACASKPIVDIYNVNLAQYDRDLADCERVAEQVATGQITAKSAGFGAAVGAAQGLVWGHVGTSAASGAISGGAGGLLHSDHEKSTVTKNCLRYRGYAVLN